jgi:hypothetical protein
MEDMGYHKNNLTLQAVQEARRRLDKEVERNNPKADPRDFKHKSPRAEGSRTEELLQAASSLLAVAEAQLKVAVAKTAAAGNMIASRNEERRIASNVERRATNTCSYCRSRTDKLRRRNI